MRKFLIAVAAAGTVLLAGALSSTPADAMTLPAPAGMNSAIADSSVVDDVRYVCRRYRVCGYYGCRWRSRCYYTRSYYRPRYRYYRRYY
jgi:hypothetical protein